MIWAGHFCRPTTVRRGTMSPSNHDAEEAAPRRRVRSSADSSRSAVRQHRSLLLRRSMVLTFLSTLLPGLGLVFTRRRRLGLILLSLAVLGLLAVGITFFAGGMINGAARTLTRNGLKVALAVIVIAVALWLTSIAITAKTTRISHWNRMGEGLFRGFTALMCLAITMPAALAVKDVAVAQDAFGKIFISNNGGQHKENAFEKKDRVNFLLIGSDAGKDRFQVRTDSLIVASVDTKTGDTTLISIPRNLQKAPFPESNPLHKLYPEGFSCPERGNSCIMDAVWAEAAVEHPDLFKGNSYPGLTTTVDVVSEITGLPIDYSTVVNLQGFRDLVDAMGGVTLNIPKGGIAIGGKISGGVVTGITGRIPEGEQHLDGQHALWYARSRVETGDADRMRRQRCMVNALIDQTNPFAMVQRFPSIMRVAKENIMLDLPQDQLPDLADLVNRIKSGQMKSVNIAYPVISDSDPDYDKIRQLVKKGLERPKATAKPKPKKSSSSSTTSPSTSSSQSSTSSADPVSDTAASC